MQRQAVILADQAGVIRFWSDGAERLFGHDAGAAVGETLDLVVPQQFREAHWRGFSRAMRHPERKDLAADIPVVTADGDLRTLPGRLMVLLDGLGAAAGAVAVFAPDGTTGVRPFG